MGNILLVSEDNNVIEKYKKLFDNKYHTFGNCCTETTLFDKIETDPADVFIFDANVSFQNLTLILKKVKSILENAILFLTNFNRSFLNRRYYHGQKSVAALWRFHGRL